VTGLGCCEVVVEDGPENRPDDTGHSFQTQAESDLREELPVFGESLDLRSVRLPYHGLMRFVLQVGNSLPSHRCCKASRP
jgi:hypothetical protein